MLLLLLLLLLPVAAPLWFLNRGGQTRFLIIASMAIEIQIAAPVIRSIMHWRLVYFLSVSLSGVADFKDVAFFSVAT